MFLSALKLNASMYGRLKHMSNVKNLFLLNLIINTVVTDYHQNTMGRPRTFDPTECKHAIRHLNVT